MEALLFPVLSQYYAGNYQAAMNQANSLSMPATKPSAEQALISPGWLAIMKSVLIDRCYLAQKRFSLVWNAGSQTSQALQALAVEPRLLKAQALWWQASSAAQREEALAVARQAIEKGLAELPVGEEARLPWCALFAAEIMALEGLLDESLRTLAPYRGKHLECMALMVQLLLRMHRVDLAEKTVEAMHALHEDAIPTQLAESWVCLTQAKYQQAYYIYQELMERLGISCKLLNAQAVCQIHMGNFETAEKLLLDSLQKVNDDADTLANLVVVSQQLHKPAEVMDRYRAYVSSNTESSMSTGM